MFVNLVRDKMTFHRVHMDKQPLISEMSDLFEALMVKNNALKSRVQTNLQRIYFVNIFQSLFYIRHLIECVFGEC